MTLHPRHPRHLAGSKWTAARPRGGALHWEVERFDERAGQVTLHAVLTGERRTLAWQALRERRQWLPGWTRPAAASTIVVGAGLAGSVCAARLEALGERVLLLDKARGAGGRASTRRAGELRFDHGAQLLSARDPGFLAQVEAWEQAGVLARWEARRVELSEVGAEPQPGDAFPRWVGTPGMSSWLRALHAELEVRYEARVSALRRSEAGWRVELEDGELLGPVARVLVATPAPQAVPLLAEVPELARAAAQIEFAPCWALLVAFAAPWDPGWDAARIARGTLGWVARDASKPGRAPVETWVAHASPEWSAGHLEADPPAVADALLAALAELAPLPERLGVWAHRWRYARAIRPLGLPCLWDPELGVGLAGDGCLGERLEEAYLSGAALATAVGRSLELSPTRSAAGGA